MQKRHPNKKQDMEWQKILRNKNTWPISIQSVRKNQSCDERILSRNVRVRTEYAVRRSRNAVRTQSERSRYAPGLQVKSAATQAVTPGMPFTSGSSSPTTHNALPDRTLPPPSPQPSTTPSRDTATAIRFLTFVCSHDCLMLLDLA